MKRFWIRLALSLCGLCAPAILVTAAEPAGNLLANGDFEAAEPAWLLHTEQDAKATFAVEKDNGDAVGHVTVTQVGKRNHVQFACPLPQASLAIDQIHRVTFRARSSRPRNMRVVLIEAGKPWGLAGLGTHVQVTAGWKTFELFFRAKAVPSPDLKLDFFLGDVAGDFWLDDVSLHRVDVDRLFADRVAQAVTKVKAQTSTYHLSDTGCVVAVRDSRTAQVLIQPLREEPAFRLRTRHGTDMSELTSADASRISHTRTGDRVSYVAELADMTVRYTYEPHGRDGLLACRIRVENRGHGAAIEVDFPVVACRGRLGESSEDDRLLYPLHDGGMVVDPYKTMMGRTLRSTYPGPLSCQVMAFYDPDGGLLMASLDPTGQVKRLLAEGGLNVCLGVSQLRPQIPGADVVVDEPVVMGVFKGPWHAAAEVYRKWAHRQAFCAVPLHTNPDFPAKLRQGAVVNYFAPGKRDKKTGERQTMEELDGLVAKMEAAHGMPQITISWGWEQHGMWCSQEYFPAYPSDEDFAARGSLFGRYGMGMVMLSGYRWTFDKPWAPRGPYDGTERFEREVKPWVTHAEHPMTPTIKTGKPTHYKGKQYATMCRATKFSRDIISEVSQRCVKAGYTIIHFDQVTGGGAGRAYCLSPNHGHPPGFGRWGHTALVDLYRRLRQDCAALSPDFALSMEEPGELYIPYLQLIQSRPYVITPDFPISPPMAEAVPLFMYLYHDYLAGWASHVPAWWDGHPHRSIAKAFAAGCMPGMLHGHLYSPRIRWAPSCREMFMKCCRLYRDGGVPFLLYGRMLNPLPIAVPTKVIQVRRKKKKAKQPLSVPAFYHSVWQAPDGRRAVAFFNPEETAHTVRLPDGREATVPARDGLLCELKN